MNPSTVRVLDPDRCESVLAEINDFVGAEYTEEFQELFPGLAKKNGAALVPFLLEGVADKPELNLSDGNHPTVEGHRIVAETVWATLAPVLEKLRR